MREFIRTVFRKGSFLTLSPKMLSEYEFFLIYTKE